MEHVVELRAPGDQIVEAGVARLAEILDDAVQELRVPDLVLDLRGEGELSLERGRAQDPVALGEDAHQLGVRVHLDELRQTSAVLVRHPVPRLDEAAALDVGEELLGALVHGSDATEDGSIARMGTRAGRARRRRHPPVRGAGLPRHLDGRPRRGDGGAEGLPVLAHGVEAGAPRRGHPGRRGHIPRGARRGAGERPAARADPARPARPPRSRRRAGRRGDGLHPRVAVPRGARADRVPRRAAPVRGALARPVSRGGRARRAPRRARRRGGGPARPLRGELGLHMDPARRGHGGARRPVLRDHRRRRARLRVARPPDAMGAILIVNPKASGVSGDVVERVTGRAPRGRRGARDGGAGRRDGRSRSITSRRRTRSTSSRATARTTRS